MRKIAYSILLLSLAVFMAAPVAKAKLLADGGHGSPDSLPVGCFGGAGCPTTLVASIFDGTYSATLGGRTQSGIYDAVVLRVNNPADGLCVGCLDFEVQIDDDTSSCTGKGCHAPTIDRITMADFSGWTTDAGFNPSFKSIDDDYSGTRNMPLSVDRSLDGSTIGFNFRVGTPITTGNSSVILEIETNARYWTTGTISIDDSIDANALGFAPSAVEPSSAALLLLVIVAIAAGLRLRRSALVA